MPVLPRIAMRDEPSGTSPQVETESAVNTVAKSSKARRLGVTPNSHGEHQTGTSNNQIIFEVVSES